MAQDTLRQPAPPMDSVEISLLTCGPGHEVYSLYGHTALRYHDKAQRQDIAINYGMFSFAQRFFILRFVFGLTDYEMGIAPFDYFLGTYRYEGRWVREQTLNLTNEEKQAIHQAIEENYRPENRVYRYNYFYDNCTTRARDMITDHIDGKVSYEETDTPEASFRSMTHQWNTNSPWSRLGNDLLLGVKADRPATRSQRQFLPDTLSHDFDRAIIIDNHGNRRKLVSKTEMLYEPAPIITEPSFPLPPSTCAWMIFLLVVVVIIAEAYCRKLFWGFDALLLTADGAAGIILLAMVFSQHPTVSLNFQILMLCPLSISFVYPVVRNLRRHRYHHYLTLLAAMTLVMLLLGFWQQYNNAIYIVALSLLIRFIALRYWCTHRNTNK